MLKRKTSLWLLMLVWSGPAARAASLAEEVELLRRQVSAQGQQIEQLQQALEAQRQLLNTVLPGRAALVRAAATVPAEAPPAPPPQAAAESKPSPLSVRVGSAEFTPGGFMDFTAIFRSTNVGSGIGTAFGSLPFSNSPAGRLTETRFTAQNSRVNLRVNSKVGRQDVTGYVEADFLGFQPTNGFVTSNSNSMRMRLYWVDVRRDKWELLGGQSWTFLTPNRTGLSAMPSDLFYSQDVDTNYQVGLTWARQSQFRAIYHPNRSWTAGISVENPQQFIGSGVSLPARLAPALSGQLDNGSLTSTPNLHPDLIAKIAFDGNAGGRHMHVDAAGLLRSFRVFDPAGNRHATATGGGESLNANLEVFKNFHLIVNSFYSYGGGRYIFGLGPDLVVRPDGAVSLVHAGSGIGGFEYQATPATLYYGYYGGAYFQRNFSVDAAGHSGFGFPGAPPAANRSFQEATFGVIRTFWRNPNYGALQLLTQYSYVLRNPWSLAPGQPKNAHTNLGYVNLRYVLP